MWRGLVLTCQGRYREAAAHMRDAFRLDPLSPIINTNVGFDALRYGDAAEAEARFAAAIEIDPAFQVPYSGMARLHAARGATEEALRWIDQAVARGWRNAWWTRHDWNWTALADESRFRALLARGGPYAV